MRETSACAMTCNNTEAQSANLHMSDVHAVNSVNYISYYNGSKYVLLESSQTCYNDKYIERNNILYLRLVAIIFHYSNAFFLLYYMVYKSLSYELK